MNRLQVFLVACAASMGVLTLVGSLPVCGASAWNQWNFAFVFSSDHIEVVEHKPGVIVLHTDLTGNSTPCTFCSETQPDLDHAHAHDTFLERFAHVGASDGPAFTGTATDLLMESPTGAPAHTYWPDPPPPK